MKTLQKIAYIGALIASMAACSEVKDPGKITKTPVSINHYWRTGADDMEPKSCPHGFGEFVYREGYTVKFDDGTTGTRNFERTIHSTPECHTAMYGPGYENQPRNADYDVVNAPNGILELEVIQLNIASKLKKPVEIKVKSSSPGHVEIEDIVNR